MYAFAASLAVLFLMWINPWERLGLMGGDYLTGLLCATGIVGLAVLRPDWKSADDEWRALLCSLLAWLILVVGLLALDHSRVCSSGSELHPVLALALDFAECAAILSSRRTGMSP